jgi:hypothetical protein
MPVVRRGAEEEWTMSVLRQKPLKKPLTHARRRALKVLANAPEGYTEAMLLARGIGARFVAEFVRDGLASERTERVKMSNRTVDVVRIQLTDLGRQTLGSGRRGRPKAVSWSG